MSNAAQLGDRGRARRAAQPGCAAVALAAASVTPMPAPRQPLPTPADGPDFKEGFELNNRYLLMLDPDNLLYNFR